MTAETESVPVNRFALFSETMLAGVIVLGLSVPLVTVPAAYAAGTAHLGRHLSGRDDSVRGLWGTFRSALPGSLKLGLTTAAVAAVVIVNLLLAAAGQLPGRAVVLPATLLVAAAATVLLLRTASSVAARCHWAEALAAAADGVPGGLVRFAAPGGGTGPDCRLRVDAAGAGDRGAGLPRARRGGGQAARRGQVSQLT